MENKKKVGRPVKYVYLDKYERTTKQLEERIDALGRLHEFLLKQQTKTQKIQLAIVAILCVSFLASLIF